MGFVRSSLSIAAASALGFGAFLAAPAQAAQYPPTKPVRCGAKIDGNDIGIKIRPLKNKGYEFKVQKRKGKGNWKVVRTGKTRASDGQRVVRNLPKGRYRVVCVGGPDRLDGITSSGRVR
jgi:hypothetical protein